MTFPYALAASNTYPTYPSNSPADEGVPRLRISFSISFLYPPLPALCLVLLIRKAPCISSKGKVEMGSDGEQGLGDTPKRPPLLTLPFHRLLPLELVAAPELEPSDSNGSDVVTDVLRSRVRKISCYVQNRYNSDESSLFNPSPLISPFTPLISPFTTSNPSNPPELFAAPK